LGGALVPGCETTSEIYYYYYDEGNVTNVFTENLAPVGGEKPFSATALVYAKNNRTVTFAVGEEWTDETDYEAVWGREYRYDQARARYLRSVLDPVALSNGEYTGEAIWSQYDGDEIYADYTLNMGDATVTRWYEPGIGMVEDVSGTPVVKYYHDNLIGTTRFMTDAAGNKTESAVYTAFGEPVNGDPRRFGFVGAYGYQTDTTPDTMTFLHVGHRYYDPSIGRFLQRDPIGLKGGLNPYVYVDNTPTCDIDPAGLGKWWDKVKDTAKKVKDAIKEAVKYIAPSPGGEVAGAMECGPDLVRITIAKKHRDKVIDSKGDLNDALDEYEEGRDDHVKPGG
jgi:RHS repeat-associated protein